MAERSEIDLQDVLLGLGFGANSTGFDDVYILSIPTFTWVQVYPDKNKPRKKSEEYPHYDLTCTVIRNSQMLVIGGQFPKDLDAKNVPLPFFGASGGFADSRDC